MPVYIDIDLVILEKWPGEMFVFCSRMKIIDGQNWNKN